MMQRLLGSRNDVRLNFIHTFDGKVFEESTGEQRVPVKDETVVFHSKFEDAGQWYRVTAVHWHYGPNALDRSVDVYVKERDD